MPSPTKPFARPTYNPLLRFRSDDVCIFLFFFSLLALMTGILDRAYWALVPLLLLTSRPLKSNSGLLTLTIHDRLVLIFSLSAVISFGFSEYYQTSLVPTAYVASYYLVVFIVSLAIRSNSQINVLLVGSVLGFLVITLRSMFQANVGFDPSNSQLEGALGQSNGTGSLAGVAVVCSLVYIRFQGLGIVPKSRSILLIAATWATLALALITLVLSASRGSNAAVAVFIALWALPLLKRLSLFHQIAAVVSVSAAVWLMWATVLQLFVVKRFLFLAWELGIASAPPPGRFIPGVDIREALKDKAVEIFNDNPIIGTGVGTFREFSRYSYTHTTFYEILYSMGLVGTAVALAFWGGMFVRFLSRTINYRGQREYFWILLCIMIFMMTQGATLPLVASRAHMPLLILLIAAARLGVASGPTARERTL